MALAAEDSNSLNALLEKSSQRELDAISFREPDLDDELTALAFAPHPHNRKLLSNLPLAGKGE